jgi:hypothetical protein
MLVYREVSHAVSPTLHVPADFQDGWMLHTGSNNVATVRQSFGDAFNRRVIALRGTGGKQDLLGLFGSKEICNTPASRRNRLGGSPRRIVHAAGVEVEILEERGHGLVDLRSDSGGGVVVGVDDVH